MNDALLIFGSDPRRRYRFLQKPLESVGIGCGLVEDSGKGLAHCPEMRTMLQSRDWSAVIIFGGDIRVGLRVAEARRYADAPVVLRYGGDPFANRKARSREWVKRGRWITAARSISGLYQTSKAIFSVDGLIAVGPTLLEQLQRRAGPQVAGVVAPPVIDLPVLPSLHKKGEPGGIRVLTVSNFSYRSKSKGVDVIAKAFSEAAEKLDLEVRLDILGGGLHESEVRSKWAGQQGQLKVRCHGNVADVTPYLRDADVFAYCSTLDAYPLSILEAQIHGLPVMVNSHGFSRDFLVDGKDAVFFDANDHHSATDVALRLLDSAELRAEIGGHGRESANRRNDPVRVGESVKAFIRDLQEKR